jgi:hypothetical protein
MYNVKTETTNYRSSNAMFCAAMGWDAASGSGRPKHECTRMIHEVVLTLPTLPMELGGLHSELAAGVFAGTLITLPDVLL